MACARPVYDLILPAGTVGCSRMPHGQLCGHRIVETIMPPQISGCQCRLTGRDPTAQWLQGWPGRARDGLGVAGHDNNFGGEIAVALCWRPSRRLAVALRGKPGRPIQYRGVHRDGWSVEHVVHTRSVEQWPIAACCERRREAVYPRIGRTGQLVAEFVVCHHEPGGGAAGRYTAGRIGQASCIPVF